MALIDMKRPKPKKSEMAREVSTEDIEKYSYGLRLSLHGEEIEKLGDQLNNVTLGGMVTITAKAEVVGYNIGGNLYDGKKSEDSDLTLQIQKLEVTPTASKADNSLRALKQRLRNM